MNVADTANENSKSSGPADADPPPQPDLVLIDPKLLAMHSENDGRGSAQPPAMNAHPQPGPLPPTGVEAGPVANDATSDRDGRASSVQKPSLAHDASSPNAAPASPGAEDRKQVPRAGPCQRCARKGMGHTCVVTPSRTACDECHRRKKRCEGAGDRVAAAEPAPVHPGRPRKRAADGSASDPDRPSTPLRKGQSPPSRQAPLGELMAAGGPGVARDPRGADKANVSDVDVDFDTPAAHGAANVSQSPAHGVVPVVQAAASPAAPAGNLAAARPNVLEAAAPRLGAQVLKAKECLWLCTLCPTGTPASKYPETLRHVLTSHHPLLMAGLKEQARSGLCVIGGNTEVLLQCRFCKETFVAVLDQMDIALNHVADVHLSEMKKGVFAHAETCMRLAA